MDKLRKSYKIYYINYLCYFYLDLFNANVTIDYVIKHNKLKKQISHISCLKIIIYRFWK
jgi:hypothetical protein